jgi:PBP1b-binding outer membrane lipoprotein LpoB
MRALLLIAGAALALGGCGNNDQTDKTQNSDENLTAQNIVSNDVTAIDAVTGDAANMAADVDTNYGNLDNSALESNGVTRPSVPKPKTPREGTLSPAPDPSTTTVANTQ